MKHLIPFLLLVIFLLIMIAATGHAQPPFRGGYYVSSEFHSEIGKGGERRNSLHIGTDLVPIDNDKIIFNVKSGIVSEIGVCPIYGKYVKVYHGDDLYSRYGHGETIFNSAEVGSYVNNKTPLMKMGNTGYSDRAHLHVEVYREIEIFRNGIPEIYKYYFDALIFFEGE